VGDRTLAPSPIAKFKGLLTYLDEKGTFNDVTPTSATVFTEANILDAFRLVYASLFTNSNMKKVRSMKRKYVKFIVSPNTAEILQNGEIDGYTGKGQTELTAGSSDDLRYKGTPIKPLAGFPDNQILLTYADSDPMNSNLHFGMANQRDKENVKVFNMANGADNLGMRMNFTAGVAVAWPEFVTRYIVPA
jgi:hypothetical protein